MSTDGDYLIVFITKVLLLLAIIVINTFVWVLYNGLSILFKFPLPSTPSLLVFSMSHCLGSFFLATNIFHSALFNEHWTAFSMINALTGAFAGQAPLNLAWTQIVFFELVIFLCTICIVISVRLTISIFKHSAPPIRSSKHKTSPTTHILLWLSTIGILLSSQWWLKETPNTRTLDDTLPIFTLVGHKKEYRAEALGLASLVNNEAIKVENMQQLSKNKLLHNQKITAQRTPDILMIHIESYRADMLTPENTPNIYNFSKKNVLLNNHYSSSNNTPTAMFSVLTGLSGSYYQYFREHPHTPVPIQILDNIGYQFYIHHSDNLDYQDIGDFLLPGFKRFQGKGATYSQRDASSINHLLAHIKSRKGNAQPRFDYLTIDSPHFPYHYPDKGYEKFTPVIPLGYKISSSSFAHMESKKNELQNRFMNSIYYADTLVGELLKGLKRQKELSNRIIIIFGDHGEEFWEHQRYGHTFGMVNEQVKVTTIMSFPEDVTSDYNYSGHRDIMPTILNYMQVPLSFSAFSNGKDLLHYEKEKDFTDVSMGIISRIKRYEYAAIGYGLKITYKLKNKLEIKSITTDSDIPLKKWNNTHVSSLIKKTESNLIHP